MKIVQDKIVSDYTPKRIASILLHLDLLKECLYFPKEADIIGAEWDFSADAIRLYIEGDCFKEVELGNCVPIICPNITKNTDKEGKIEYTWDWNI